MKRRAVLLIGTEKTGTTTLQQFLGSNRAALAARGFFYPSFCGDWNHTGLAAYALNADRKDDIRFPHGAWNAEDVPAMRARIEAAAQEELATASGTVLFCNEHCHSRLTEQVEVERLRNLLGPFFDEIKIAVYLRRQDQVALSLYSTQIKSGATHQNLMPLTTASDPYYNYDLSLSIWARVFGEENILPRIFDRALLLGGSIVQDFCSEWGLGPTDSYQGVPDFNGSINGAAIEFLRQFNLTVGKEVDIKHPFLRGMLCGQLEALFAGPGPRPARDTARAFYEMFRASNAELRRRYFPERSTLFNENFETYPEVADPWTFGCDEALHVGMRLSMAAMLDIRRLESEVALRDGRLYWAKDRREEAKAALRSAVRLNPKHPEMQRTLAEYLFHAGRFAEAASAVKVAVEQRPESAEYWHFMGLALRRCGRNAEAAEAQGRALAIQPDYQAAREELNLVDPFTGAADGATSKEKMIGSNHAT